MIGTTVGTYRIVDHLGAGGTGAVYLAEQENPRRTVALKMMNHGIFSEEARWRFRYEADVLAALYHPGIAQFHEVGTWEGNGQVVPFFAMEHIQDAQRLDRWADGEEIRSVLQQFVRICDAIHHAQRHGVINATSPWSNSRRTCNGYYMTNQSWPDRRPHRIRCGDS